MKRAQSRFSKLPRFEPGGLLNFLNKPGADGTKGGMGAGIGAGLDVLSGVTGMIGNKGQSAITNGNPYAEGAMNTYNNTLAKSQKTKQMVSGTMNKLGTAAMATGVLAPLGLALKGAAALNNLIPYGKKKADAAMGDFNAMNQAGEQMDIANQGAINYNSNNAGYKAVAYGKKGMKFKTKF